MLDLLLAPSTHNTTGTSNSATTLRPPAPVVFLVHALRSHSEEVPQCGDVAELGRLVDVAASGCGSGFHQRDASGRLRKLREKIRKKNDIKKIIPA